ncbi:MAG TPA: glycerophosphodiester phosphodiesterase [Acidimicrobiales bacterium]|nr:glycerophosphodiester phosphodiesterase [Acidimicrobiales bacterium]
MNPSPAIPTNPGVPRFAFLDHDAPIAFAHRGGALENPENTWASFHHAHSLGYRYMETDVHATRDGVAAVIHDPDLRRVAGVAADVRAMTWSELSKVDLEGDQRVPRLDELLEEWPETRWNIDAKHDSAVDTLVETVKRTNTTERVCITSFSGRRLGTVKRALGPTLCTAMGPAAITALRVASLPPRPPARLLRAGFRGFGAAQVPTRQGAIPIVDTRFVATSHTAALQVHVWTIDEEAEMDRLLDLGVDGIMTDRPSLLREVLQRRGAWVSA